VVPSQYGIAARHPWALQDSCNQFSDRGVLIEVLTFGPKADMEVEWPKIDVAIAEAVDSLGPYAKSDNPSKGAQTWQGCKFQDGSATKDVSDAHCTGDTCSDLSDAAFFNAAANPLDVLAAPPPPGPTPQPPSDSGSDPLVPIIIAVAACAVIGLMAGLFMMRRNKKPTVSDLQKNHTADDRPFIDPEEKNQGDGTDKGIELNELGVSPPQDPAQTSNPPSATGTPVGAALPAANQPARLQRQAPAGRGGRGGTAAPRQEPRRGSAIGKPAGQDMKQIIGYGQVVEQGVL